MEAVDGEVVGGSFGGCFAAGMGRGCCGGNGGGFVRGRGMEEEFVIEEHGGESLSHVELDVVGEHTEEDMGTDARGEPERLRPSASSPTVARSPPDVPPASPWPRRVGPHRHPPPPTLPQGCPPTSPHPSPVRISGGFRNIRRLAKEPEVSLWCPSRRSLADRLDADERSQGTRRQRLEPHGGIKGAAFFRDVRASILDDIE